MASRRAVDLSSSVRVPGSSKQGFKFDGAKSRLPKEVPGKLAAKARTIADQLLKIKESMDKVMATLQHQFQTKDEENPKTLRDWNSVRKTFNSLIAETRSQATSGSTILKGASSPSRICEYVHHGNWTSKSIVDFLETLLPYLLSMEESMDDRTAEIQEYTNKLLKSPSDHSENIKNLLSKVIREIDVFRRSWPRGPDTDYARLIEPEVQIVVNSISSLAESSMRGCEDINLEHSFPGVMKTSIILLPPDVARSLFKAFEGECDPRFANPGSLRALKYNLLDRLMNVEHMLLADVQAFPKVFSDHVKRHDELGCMSKLELIRDLYGYLKKALEGFGDTMVKYDLNKSSGSKSNNAERAGRNGPPNPPPSSSSRAGQPPKSRPVAEKTSFFGRIFGGLFGKKKR
ncbi:hypothetical protein SCHPADRAFT_940358 [Schizopora paradoxa]|uniref:Uncharacterized protein n=1 Tax=Schizopora paradoxa TaxID=27342 RepID=A0A0H2S9C6_9AGAM|nr:hypothetical protein SCHPADRAFT_940358 [Schizopora paradoxa]